MSEDPAESGRDRITKDTTVEEIVEKYPGLVGILMERNIPCLVCGEPLWGTIEEAARRYDVDMDDLLRSLNGAAGKE